MATPGNNPQNLQNSVREKLKRFDSELSPEERAYVEARIKQAVAEARTKQAVTSAATPAATRLGMVAPQAAPPGSITVQSPSLVINQSSKNLVITNIDYSGGSTPVFDAPSSPSQQPQVGDIITAGNNYGSQFTWIEWFFGSNCAIDMQAQDGSGTIRTEVGMSRRRLGLRMHQCNRQPRLLRPRHQPRQLGR
jgi:hypothetical protein